ncbi:MAG: hypothetical protein GY861_24270 [bacterium]|nr:hypothetical protein [bacterium]
MKTIKRSDIKRAIAWNCLECGFFNTQEEKETDVLFCRICGTEHEIEEED